MSTRVRPVVPTAVPSVTVVIPHFNYGHYLSTSVRSVLSQTGVELDVIIVDDASAPESLEVARSLANTHDRVALVEHSRNMRHIATYNDGLGRAQGNYVVLLSADDALAPGSLARATALMEANPSVGLVYGQVETFADAIPRRPTTSESHRMSSWTVWGGEEWIQTICRRGRNLIATPEVVMRRDVLDQIGGYDARFPHSADLYMWLRSAARADVGWVNGVVQAFYRIHQTNMHSTQFGGLLDDYCAVRATFDAFLDADRVLLHDTSRMRRNAHRALAREAVRRAALLRDLADGDVDRLLEFAEDTDPTDSFIRSLYRSALHTGTSAPLRKVEQLRWHVRYHRQLRFGT